MNKIIKLIKGRKQHATQHIYIYKTVWLTAIARHFAASCVHSEQYGYGI